jgi:hypothetical protein
VLAQVTIDPTSTPVLNNGGWVYNSAVLLAGLGLVITLLLVFGYMRFAPRFQTEEGARSVRAPRIQPGRDVRRPVNVTSTPLIVQPPTVTVAAPAPQPAVVAAAPAPAAAPPPAPAVAPPAEAPAAAPAAPPEGAAAAPTEAPAPTPAPAAGEHKEVQLDQEVFDAKLAELLDKGTDRRVAEGQARRAAMIAARKKAEGG